MLGTALQKQLLPSQALRTARLLLTSRALPRAAGRGESSGLPLAWAGTPGAGGW